MVRKNRRNSKSSRKETKHVVCTLLGDWWLIVLFLHFGCGSVWALGTVPRQRGGRRKGGLRNGTEMGNKKNDRDGPRPGRGFWNREGNEMVQRYQFNWKLESSILQPTKSGEEKKTRVMGRGGNRKDRTACKGHTAQFTSVKETIWLQFHLLSHSELKFIICACCPCECVHLCVFVFVSMCSCIDVSVFVFVCECFWLFGSLCSRCTGLLLCSDILNG